jgi:ribonuclease-3
MNGEEKGIGVGKSQKIAKEDAARQAWVAMGWGG